MSPRWRHAPSAPVKRCIGQHFLFQASEACLLSAVLLLAHCSVDADHVFKGSGGSSSTSGAGGKDSAGGTSGGGGAAGDTQAAGEAGNPQECRINAQCNGGQICLNRRCVDLGCYDGIQDQDETGTDCGGSMCEPCAAATGGKSAGSGGTASAPQGGTSSSRGGTSSTNGGAGGAGGAGGTGGGSAVAECTPYKGALKVASKPFVNGYGVSGTWMGHAYTYSYGAGVVVTPIPTETMSCFVGNQLCAAGSIAAYDSSGAGIGWSIAQARDDEAKPVSVASVKLQLAGATAGMRVSLQPGDQTEGYCYTLSAADATTANAGLLNIPISSFQKFCYSPEEAIPYTGQPVLAIDIFVLGDNAAAKQFDFCIVDVQGS
ncbi:MAG TPA: hypothetical protein VFQ61_14600 [Polyangiaceae bacterium]|nr:hypothetical protein [Polyangiaceae bacterium]